MRIAYIISTCAKYFDTRVTYQLGTFLKHVRYDDIYYLTSKSDPARRHFGWGCMDDAQSITWKYIHFFIGADNMSAYDWCVFIDDDTFVFTNRLEAMLCSMDASVPAYIGKQLNHISSKFCAYMSGGAGYVMSRALYAQVSEYVRRIGANKAYYPIINLKEQFCDDLCVGIWVHAASASCPLTNDERFHLESDNGAIDELSRAITYHKVITAEQFAKYGAILDAELAKSVVVLVGDQAYLQPLMRTVADLRCITRGNWSGDIVVIALDGLLLGDMAELYSIKVATFPSIDKTHLLAAIGPTGFPNSVDGRELKKPNQWEKLHVFDDYFRRWRYVVYLDAGLRVFADINTHLFSLDCTNRILAPRDGKLFETPKPFKCQVTDNAYFDFLNDTEYMLNCMWIYDTAILNVCGKAQLIEAMNMYPVCRTNEMGIMNIILHYKYHLWERLPVRTKNGDKFLFDWCELNQPGTTWRDFCFLKYSRS